MLFLQKNSENTPPAIFTPGASGVAYKTVELNLLLFEFIIFFAENVLKPALQIKKKLSRK